MTVPTQEVCVAHSDHDRIEVGLAENASDELHDDAVDDGVDHRHEEHRQRECDRQLHQVAPIDEVLEFFEHAVHVAPSQGGAYRDGAETLTDELSTTRNTHVPRNLLLTLRH